ncbi:MAG: hypothetical protein ACJ8EE_14405 [Bradyrhizobium sp.]
MADEAFALSPISARAVQPSEEDYAAISEAFMETSRGRWFLTEYAKRNRNADTSMVLDAVSRIETTLVAQREENLATQRQAAETSLAEALAAIRSAVDAAQASAIEALDGLALEHKLASLRKGARVIREISWRLREIGNDGRICDLIDSQVAVIENGAAQISSDETKAALEAAFTSIASRLAEFSDADEAPPPPVADALAAAVVEEVQVAPAPEVFEAPDPAWADAPEPAAEVADEAAADAHDEAVLDMIAMEMGAPEPFEFDDTAAMIVEEAYIAEYAPAEPQMTVPAPEPIAEPAGLAAEIPPQAPVESRPEPPMEISLGSTIIASGIVRKPQAAANDPLASIRRMSQAEKIAFFS